MAPRPGPLGMQKIDQGLYVVWRRLEIDGAFHYREMVCINPAYAYRALGDWEAEIRTRRRTAAAA